MTQVTFQNLIDALNELYPPTLAEDWDPIGLHFGDPKAPVNKIMTTLDVRHAVVDEAIKLGVDTIIAHHPLLFQPIQRFDLSSLTNQLYAKLIKHDIKVFAMHTNLDIAHNGMNDWLAEQLGLVNIRELGSQATDELPGLGRIGQLANPLSRTALLDLLKSTYQRNELPIIEKTPQESYQTIAIIGGSGSSLMEAVASQEVDVFLTGDITYHTAQALEDIPMMTVDVGHYTESIFAKKAAEVIQLLVNEKQWPVIVQATELNINPFRYE